MLFQEISVAETGHIEVWVSPMYLEHWWGPKTSVKREQDMLKNGQQVMRDDQITDCSLVGNGDGDAGCSPNPQ